MADLYDEDALQKYFRRMGIDQQNQQAERQGMQGLNDAANPPPNPYAQSGDDGGFLGTVGKIVAPIMKLGGMAATALGQPYIGVPLSIAGGAVGGAGNGGGITGALEGAATSGVGQAASYGLGSAFDALKTPINDPIDMASKGLTIPGRRMESIDLGNMTVPASPKSFGGGMS